jgi:CheY-like chemotaxis protein
VLVVDADPALAALLAEWLCEAGCDVEHPGLDHTNHGRRYDLAIVDVPFPRRGGASRVAEIAARYPGLPIIAVSAAFFPGVDACPEVASRLGVSLTLSKPLFRHALLRAVQRLLTG